MTPQREKAQCGYCRLYDARPRTASIRTGVNEMMTRGAHVAHRFNPWAASGRMWPIPSYGVVDGWPQRMRAASLLIARWYTTRRRKTSHKIPSTISRGWNFTTQSEGV